MNKHFLIPGIGFVCVESSKEGQLGSITREIDFDISMERGDL